jgi:hypothetical protein
MKIHEIVFKYIFENTEKNYQSLLRANQFDNPVYDNPNDLIEVLLSADPTTNNIYKNYILQRYAAKEFQLKDLDDLKQYLEIFERFKEKYKVSLRLIGREESVNIFDYSLDDLKNRFRYEFVPKDFLPHIPGSGIIYNGPDGQLCRPHDLASSKFWCSNKIGEPTSWCTSKSDMFAFFTRTGTRQLFIWIDKTGKKFQFHIESGEYKDANNRDIDLQSFFQKYPSAK